jgi:putative molybdopterin biosynthesis protein
VPVKEFLNRHFIVKTIEHLDAFEKIKILAAPNRLDLLRRLMAGPATLTQLGEATGRSPAWVRHHVKILEAAGLVELSEVRSHGIVVEKYYRAAADAYLLQQIILPATRQPVVIYSGSHDLAIDVLTTRLSDRIVFLTLPVGSLDGLVNLRLGLCQVSGTHLMDESGEYNVPFIRRFFPDRSVDLITFANRVQGLMVTPGNPKSIHSLNDLSRPGVMFINRNPGSGTRLWLDSRLKKAGIPIGAINGYSVAVKTHTQAALMVKNGKADVCLGLQAAAHEQELDFIPLFEERFDLVMEPQQESHLSPFLDFLQTVEFRRLLGSLTGYDSKHSGEHIHI